CYLDTIAQILSRGSQSWLVIAAIAFGFAFSRCIEAIGDQIKQSPRDVLWEDVGLAGSRVQEAFQIDVEALLLGPRSVPGQIEALLDESIDINNPVFTRAFTRVQQH